MESTYGNRVHAPIEEAKTRLADAVNKTVGRGGKVLIPSFSLERAQEVVYLLGLLAQEKKIPPVGVYVDSPLAVDITGLFMHHREYLDPEIRRAMDAGANPLEAVHVHYIREQRESKALNFEKRPMVIIAGSGMCESGRILHHLKNNIENSRNTVVVVGYMAQDTLGKRIVERARIVRIFGIEYELNAEVVVINAFSGHADREDLVRFAKSCMPLKRMFLVHADFDQAQALSIKLWDEGIENHIPERGETVEL
jgi:metallo-beta-lactamase family protein